MTSEPWGPAVERVGIAALEPGDGPLFVAVGVFDGIHLGHRHLIDRLVGAAREREARPTVLTFDSHPDELIAGAAPALLVDPAERVRLLEALGVSLVIVEHFDASLRATPYEAFVERIRARTGLAGFLMTADAAFGRDRGGTPETVAALGTRLGFDLVVAPPFLVDGAKVSSSAIRAAIAGGDLASAERLLGRPYEVTGEADGAVVRFPLPVALPPHGDWPAVVADRRSSVRIGDGGLVVLGDGPPVYGHTTIRFLAPERGVPARSSTV
jgi:FAD synthase